MKALVSEGPRQLSVRELPDPVPGPDEVVVRVERVGICGSDVHAYLGHDERRPPPIVLGHEAAGIVETGPGRGRRVTVNPLVTCGRCPACRAGRDNLCPERQIISMPPRPGAFAERIAIPARNLVEVPDEVPLARAALTEPIACGWHAVRLGHAALGGPAPRVLVLGGGAIGLGAALSARAQGADAVTVVEPNPARARTLRGLGLDVVEAPRAGTPPDMVIDAVGLAATRATASAAVRAGGVIVHIGLAEATGGLDIRRMTLAEITFIGTYTYTMADFRDTAAAIFSGRLGALDWPETRGLSEGPAAFADILAGKVAAPKILLDPSA
ncbi:MAG: galactitol-1-phosphate 5-dehydrogenase [Alphaproteobacteria bacterium]|nr:MAG: galactitol-1-phosphate 5-dehydrogenase [Alphaproteobacteria bacterium]